MSRGKDRLVIDLVLGLIVVIGVSSSVSPTLDAFYGDIAPWVFGALAVIGAIWALCQIPDPKLAWEIREAQRQNADAVRERARLHAEHPEVAQKLSERMLAEKLREQQGHLPPAPTQG